MTESHSVGRPRPAVDLMPAYRPGKGAAQAEAEHGITNAIKLASNENPLPPIQSIVDAVAIAATGANRYADHRATAVRERLATRLDLSPDQVTVGAGSVGLLQQVFLTYVDPGDEVVYPWRSFEVYPVYTQLMAGVAVTTPLTADHAFDLAAVAASVTERKLVLLATPNPTGTALSTADMARLLDGTTRHLSIDECTAAPDPALGDPVRD
jgi:histidinol-phosphate aminotransferase